MDFVFQDYHLAVAPLTVTSGRAQPVDFSYPIMTSGLRILYKVIMMITMMMMMMRMMMMMMMHAVSPQL
jgi:hypothetical protein